MKAIIHFFQKLFGNNLFSHNDTTNWHLKIKSKPENINLVENFVEQIRETLEITEEVHFNILVVLTEAVNNSILHGNQADPYKDVSVQCHMNEAMLYFTITDEGRGFDPDNIPNPTATERIAQPNGRGIFLMRELSDYIQYSENGKQVDIGFKVT